MAEPASFLEKLSQWFRNSITFKIFSIAFLILLLMIPSSMVESLIRERQYRKESAVNEISSKWGGSQTICGPILSVPYYEEVLDYSNNLKRLKKNAYFLPQQLKVNGDLLPEKRHRGIYEAVLYEADLALSGSFEKPDFSVWKIQEEAILWDEAELIVGISDLKGVNEKVVVQLEGQKINLQSGLSHQEVVASGISARVNLKELDSLTVFHFQTQLSINGSGVMDFIPVGEETEVLIHAPWKNPKFSGNFLPDEHSISDAHFDAQWKVLQLNRNFPQQWNKEGSHFNGSEFGVELMIGVDQYQKNERSAKYSILVLSLSFLIFFFIEVVNRKRIHPIQYLLVGLALLLFYTLLLSISEQASFTVAYVIASVAIIALISLYVNAFFKSRKFTALLSGTLLMLYGFVFVILQLQDYSLLVGSIGLFIVLSIVMYASRKIDWYSISKDEA